jgi:glycosyltransferase involved in cell wall biosynthesis
MPRSRIAILHYTAPPVVGGVESVIRAHAQLFVEAGYPVTVIAGRGEAAALPAEAGFVHIPELDSQDPWIAHASRLLEQGTVPPGFGDTVDWLMAALAPVLNGHDHLIVHNVFTKHFNLPLTAALHRMLDAGQLPHCIAWCHDLTWTSPSSRVKVHPGYPWELLRTYWPGVAYVVVSRRRRAELAELLGCPATDIRVIYNGVDARVLLGISRQGWSLVQKLGVLESDLVLLMPVRMTQAKNIEYALEVVAHVKRSGYRPKLVLTGPPDPHSDTAMAYLQMLRALRKQLDVEDEVCFVFECGPDPEQAYTIDDERVGELYRVSDLVFMPSHREGFGMPVLEAGMAGLPVLCTNMPAAEEIGGRDVMILRAHDGSIEMAARILEWAGRDPVYRMRRKVRQKYTWRRVFEHDIEPLLTGGRGCCAISTI